MKKKLIFVFGLLYLLIPRLMLADSCNSLFFNGSCTAQVGLSDLQTSAQLVLNLFVDIAAPLAVLAIIYGGIMYMLSGGDEKKAAKAKSIIVYALIGVAVIAGAWLMITFVVNFINHGL